MAQTKQEIEQQQSGNMFDIEFTRDYFVKDGTGTVHHKGERKTMNKASCEHFVRREAARYVGNKPPEEKAVEDFNPAKLVAQEKSLKQQSEQ